MIEADLVAIILAVGGLLPLLTAVAQQPQWSARTRTFIGVIVATIAGVVTYVTQFGLDLSKPSAIVTTIVGIILASVAAYQSIWKPSGISSKIENATSRTQPYNGAEEEAYENESVPEHY